MDFAILSYASSIHEFTVHIDFLIIDHSALSLQDFVLGPSRGVSYGVGMPTDLLHHQSGSTMSRLAYGQSPVGLYAQNQPLPAGRCTGEVSILHLLGNLL